MTNPGSEGVIVVPKVTRAEWIAAVRRFSAGNWRGGCDAFLMWNKAGGRVVRGLSLRRARERALCLKGL